MIVRENIEFERGKDPKEVMDVGLSNRSIKKLGDKSFYYGIKDYDKENWADFLQVPFSKIYLITNYKEPNYKEIKKYILQYDEINSIANSSHQIISLYETDLGKVIIGSDMMQGYGNEDFHRSIWGDAKTYLNFKNKFNFYSFISESIDFERGKDPKEAIDIGMRIFDIDGMGFNDDQSGDWAFSEKETEDLLEKPMLWHKEPYRAVLLSKLIPPEGRRSFSLGYLSAGPGEYDYVRYKGKLYPIHNIRNRITESISFERGKDPKETMRVGLEANAIRIKHLLKWSNKFEEVVPIDDKRAFKYLEWPLRSYPSTIFTDLEDGTETRFDNLINQNKSFIYKDTIFVNDGTGHYAPSKLYESVSFERGKDPREVMGIGDKDEQWRKKVSKMILPKGFNETPITAGPEAHLHDIAQWEGESPKGKVTVILSRNLDPTYAENPYMSTVYIGSTDDLNNISAEIPEDDMGVSRYWDNAFNWRPLHESVSFERGQDPKDIMGIGDRRAKWERGLKKVTDFFNEPWLESLIPIYAKELSEMGVNLISIKPMVYKVPYGVDKTLIETRWITSLGKEIIDHTNVPKQPNSRGEFSKNSEINVLYSLIDNIKWYEHRLMQ